MEKKIGILTLSGADNCGSLLQAYALRQVIYRELNIEAEIINYVPKSQKKLYAILDYQIKGFHTLYYALRIISKMPRIILQKRDYALFRKHYLNIVDDKISDYNELKKISKKYDIVICGSDQIWNVIMADFDAAFFLEWNQTINVAYAPSLGGINPIKYYPHIDEIRKNLCRFKMLSVREESGQDYLQQIMGKDIDIPILVDPTLLLSKDDWEKLIKKPIIRTPYIFFYSYGYWDREVNETVEKIGKIKGMPVYIMDALKWKNRKYKKYGFHMSMHGGPQNFLNFMKYADYVVVESLHGIIFSTILNKDFIYIEENSKMEGDKKTSIDSRSLSMLNLLNMNERCVQPDSFNEEKLSKEIEYTNMDELVKRKEDSIEFIRKIVN